MRGAWADGVGENSRGWNGLNKGLEVGRGGEHRGESSVLAAEQNKQGSALGRGGGMQGWGSWGELGGVLPAGR